MLEDAREVVAAVKAELERGIVGQEGFLRGLLTGLLADGHVLIEGVPGLGKTRAVNLLSDICDVAFKRLQFTPDLLPADILGTRIYNQHAASFETVRGPIFANFVLADEINRAPAKVQSALLETMQERQVTIGRESLALEPPFLVFATQNPIEQEGTYPLPEAQLDRFLLKLVVTYPDATDEAAIVRMIIQETAPPRLERLLDGAGIRRLQRATRSVFVENRVIGYAARLVRATREPEALGVDIRRFIQYGASPRGSISLIEAAQATALMEGRDAVLPDDVKAVAHPVLRHRIIPTYLAAAESVSAEQMIDQVLAAVPVP
jgi:MoxR-like ATPase